MPLIGAVQTRRPRRARKSSGEAETTAQPSPASRRGSNEARRVGERGRVALELGAQMLHEVDLVDVAAPDRAANRLDRIGVLRIGPRPLPRADPGMSEGQSLGHVPNGHGRERQRRGLGRRGDVRPPQRLREPVAEEEIRLELLAARREEAALAEIRLDLLERSLRRMELEHG